jgi:formylglycine-generating enzyme required for sulfatase activity
VLKDDFKLPKPLKKQFKYVPSGLALVDGDTLSVQSFYMLDHEVSNREYRIFLEAIKGLDSDAAEESKVRNHLWTEQIKSTYVKPMENMYHKNEAYNDYPVVNITKNAAELYCGWLQERINALMPDGEKVEVRLPLRAEFIRAGAGSNLDWQYAWGNKYMRNSEGEFLCNFTRIPQTRMSRDENNDLVLEDVEVIDKKASKAMDFMSRRNSYFPNIFEIFNLNGNVAEWLGDSENQAAGGSWYDFGYDVRLQSVKNYGNASPMVGFRPVFMVVKE